MFLLMALVTHLAYVLFAPRMGAQARMHEAAVELGENRLRLLSPEQVRRFVRHPLDTSVHAACMLSLAEHDVILQGQPVRGLWMLTIYGEGGDVLYTISDRHVPPGSFHIRFQLRQASEDKGEIALPKLLASRMVVPLQARRALLLLEAWPWHPGQRDSLRLQVERLRCAPVARPRESTGVEADKAASGAPSPIIPRPRPAH